jgi:hypothetical protein
MVQSSNVFFDNYLYNLVCIEHKSYYRYINSDTLEKDSLRLEWKKSKNKLRNEIRNKEHLNLRNRVDEIESLRSKNPRQYWQKLYALDNSQNVDNSLPMVVKDAAGNLVSGNDASQIIAKWINFN